MDIFNLIKNGETQKLCGLVESSSLDVNSMVENSDGKQVRILNAAIECNQYEICEYLLNKGADPNLRGESNSDQETSLWLACKSHVSPNIVKLLLLNGADRYTSHPPVLFHLFHSFDQTKADFLLEGYDVTNHETSFLLSRCIVKLHHFENHINNENPICVQMCKKLTDIGFNVEKDVLHTAACCLCYGSMKIILEKSNISVNELNQLGLAPLHILCQIQLDPIEKQEEVLKCIRLLLAGDGTNINLLSNEGQTAFNIVHKTGRLAEKEVLLELGANIDFPYNEGRTLLMKLIEKNDDFDDKDNVDFLMDSSDFQNCFGWDLLTFSVYIENQRFVELLLNRKFDPNLVGSNKMSPLHFTCWRKNIDIIKLLLKYGARVNAKDKFGALPSHYVFGPNSIEIKELLMDNGSIDVSEESSDFTFNQVLSDKNEEAKPFSTVYESSEDEMCTFHTKVSTFVKRPELKDSENYALILMRVHILLHRITFRFREIFPELSFTPVLSGSVSEGTKVTYPDEFDYLLYLDNFQGTVRIIENSCPSGFCRAKGLSDIDKEQGRYFNNEEYLEASKLTQNIYTIINHIASKNSIWDGLGIYLKEGPDCNSSIASMEILWIGPKYRFLPVSIDLVIALEIKDWLPKCMSGKNYNSPVLKDAVKEGCLIVVKPPKDDLDCNDYYGKNDMFRISFSKIETKIFNICPPGYKLGYMLAKALREWVPSFSAAWIKHPDYESHTKPSLPSYYLKNYLFFEMEKNPDDVDPSPIEVAYKIWKAVATALKKGTIMSFFNKNCFVHGDIESQLNNFDSYNGVWDYSDGEFSENDDVDDGKGMLYTDEEGRMQQMMSAMIVKILRDELNIEDSEVDEEDFD
uniref:Mab-21-like nucleotidyltransferase domain-containing protein n=1 Tax=Clytia hemisphaerica TaxID=252671 RepID=A0A7M5UW52_9CNID